MAKKGHSEEEILRVLREAESGTSVVEICRKHGISQQSFYLWKRKYAGLGLSELRELRQLREENGKLKRLVADLSPDRQTRYLDRLESSDRRPSFKQLKEQEVAHLIVSKISTCPPEGNRASLSRWDAEFDRRCPPEGGVK